MNFLRATLLFFAIASFTPEAFGQTTIWIGTAGDGQWSTPLNWDTDTEPTVNAEILFPAAITLPSTTTTLTGNLLIEGGEVSLSATTSPFTANTINVDASGTLDLNIPSGGQVTVTENGVSSFIGDGNGNGTLNLSGAGTLSAPAADGFAVGLGGTGIVTQSGTTNFNLSTLLAIGADGFVSNPSSPPGATTVTGGNGTYNLTGTATITTSNSIFIGAGSGTGNGTGSGGSTPTVGILNVSSTSVNAVNAANIYLGVDANSINNTFAVGNTIANTTGIVNQSAGNVTVTGTLYVGFAPGTGVRGTYNLSGTGSLNTNLISIGTNSGASGTFQQSSGTSVTTNTLNVGDSGVGTYLLQGGSLTVATALNLGNGQGSSGIMTESTGSTLTLNGTFTIGSNPLVGTPGVGVFNFNGGTLILSASGITIGPSGTFNQGASLSITAAQPVTIAAGGAYNLRAGTLSVGGTPMTGTGNFNFAGGTVAVTGTAWTDPFNGGISGTSTINTAGGGATLSGNLTGGGTLAIIGGQTVTLTGINNITDSWGATLTGNGTTLTASNGVTNLSSNGTYTIGTGATLNLASTGGATDTFSGTIAGAGTFNTDTNGMATKLVLAGVTNLSATSTTNIGTGGSLEVNQGTISNVNGLLGKAADTFDVGNGVSTGTVTLLGNNQLPAVTVNTLSTLFASNITGNSVTNNGSLGTRGTLASPSSLLITGALTSTGTLLVNSNGTTLDSFGSAGNKLASATLSGTVKVTGVGSVTNVPIVYTTGGVAIGGSGILNNTSGLATSAHTTLFSSSLSENGAHTELLLSTVQGLLLPFATTPNQAAVANTLDLVIQKPPQVFVPLLFVIDSLPANAIGPDLEQLSPEVLQYSRNIAFENSTFLAQRMDGICADLRGGSSGLDTNGIGVFTPGFDSSLGRSLGSLLAYSPFHASAPNGVNYYPNSEDSSVYPSSAPLSPHTSSSPTSDSSGETISDSPIPLKTSSEAPALRMPRMNGFIAGDVVLDNLNQSQGANNAPPAKANYTAGDAIAGVSFHITPHLSAGILFDYNQTNAKTDSSGSKTTVNTYSPGLFATYSTHGFYVNGLFAAGLNNYSNTRDIAFLGATAKSSPSGEQYVTNLDFGYDFHPVPKWTLGPAFGVTYTNLEINSFSETGAGPADLNVSSQNLDSLRSRLGGNLSYQTRTGNVLFQPNVTAMWQHEYLDNNNGITSQFNIPGTNPFTIQSASTSKNSALIGCGVTATLDNSMALYLNYLADVGADDYFAQTVIGGFKASF